MLNRIEACTVMAGNGRGGRAAALLLVGWLASRLNWELRSRVGATAGRPGTGSGPLTFGSISTPETTRCPTFR